MVLILILLSILISYLKFDTGNGYGSTNSRIRRLANLSDSLGSDLSFVDSPSLGLSITVNASGIYSIYYADRNNTAAGGDFGISLNGDVTVDISGLAENERIALQGITATGQAISVSTTIRLNAGDVIRPHTSLSNQPDSSGNAVVQLFIYQVVKF
jgi:hypothetical protein